MRKHRLSASFAGTAVAAGAAITTAITTGQPANAAPATTGPKPASPEIGDLVLAAAHVPNVSLASVSGYSGRYLSLSSPWEVGTDVRAIQFAYASHGFHLAIDGIFGPETEGVTKAFQSSRGLAADGIVGPSTWAAAMGSSAPTGGTSTQSVTPKASYVAPVHTAAPSQAVASSSSSGVSGGVWAALRQCESGGNYSTNTGNGYGGAYQFSQATWSALGEPGSPSTASPATQDAAAQKLQSQSGWGQWPACSAKLGLR